MQLTVDGIPTMVPAPWFESRDVECFHIPSVTGGWNLSIAGELEARLIEWPTIIREY